jgi:Domain of unknown function (DUF4157)
MKVAHAILQRKCACGKTTAGEHCDECEKKLQRKPVSATQAHEVPPIVHEVLRSPGKSLDQQTRAFMEPRFGHNFSCVRVHADDKAAESARVVNARAYTVGSHIAFGSGEFEPQSSDGRRLLAHELTHTIQQRNSVGAPNHIRVYDNSSAERNADDHAEAVLRMRPFVPTVLSIDGPMQMQRAAIHNGPILFEGPCEFLACNSGSCPDEQKGVACSGQKTKKGGDGKKYRPLFTCDKRCEAGESCANDDTWMAIPYSRFAYRKCNQSLVICANGRHTNAYVRDRSEREAWEVSPGIQSALAVTGSFTGSIYSDDDDAAFKKDPKCRSKPGSSAASSEDNAVEAPLVVAASNEHTESDA